MRDNGHSRGRGYNPRLMSSIWCAPQVPLYQTHIYTVLKAALPEQPIVSHERQWTQPWSRVQSQVDVIHLVRSTGAIVSNPHLHSVKSCPEKSRPIKYEGQMHGVMIAIDYSYKLDRKIFFFMVQTRPVIAQTVTYLMNFICFFLVNSIARLLLKV